MTIERIRAAVRAIRTPPMGSEYQIHDLVAAALRSAGVAFAHEVKLGPRARIDFLVGDVGVECKKGKVGSRELRAQAERYIAFDAVASLVLVVERCVFRAPTDLSKPVVYMSLSKNWGVAL